MSDIQAMGVTNASGAANGRVAAKGAPAAGVKSRQTPVHLEHLYGFTPEGKVTSVKNPGLKEILTDNGMEKVEYKLLDMTWQMLARAIAKDIYGKDIDAAKADILAKILQGDNGGLDKPAKVLAGMDPLTGGEKLISFLKYWHSNQLYVYQGFMNSTNAWFAWGRFPDKLPVNVTKAFETELMKEPAAVQDPKAKILATKQGLTVTLNAAVEDFDAKIYTWIFGDGKKESGQQIQRTYDRAGTYKVKLEVANAEGKIITSQARFKVAALEPAPTPAEKRSCARINPMTGNCLKWKD